MERCKHGLAIGSCGACASGNSFRATQPTKRSNSGGISEVYRGFTIYYTPPPDRVWSFRPSPNGSLESHRSAFQARRAIDVLIDGYVTTTTPRRDGKVTSGARPRPPGMVQSRPVASSRRRLDPGASGVTAIAVSSPIRGVPSAEMARLLQANDTRPIVTILPISNEAREIRGFVRREQRFAGTLPSNFRTIPNKVAVDYFGKGLYPEFAIVRRLERAGWSAAWRVNWHGAAFWTDIGKTGTLPNWVQDQFSAIAGIAGAGAWDVLAWKGDQLAFIESKQYRSDRLTLNQRRWLEVALGMGIPIDSFAVFEYIVS
jgi:hypothetical protein